VEPRSSTGDEAANRGISLTETIGRLSTEFSNLKDELRDTKNENDRLRHELARWRSQCRSAPLSDTAALRRHVAFYCHPDRGGDTELMSTLNALFDFLASFECGPRLCAEARQERSAA
jgi:regulator of replication initiation timing